MTLEKPKMMFHYFFNDVVFNTHADPIFIRKILTALEFKIFMPGSIICPAGHWFDDIFFI